MLGCNDRILFGKLPINFTQLFLGKLSPNMAYFSHAARKQKNDSTQKLFLGKKSKKQDKPLKCQFSKFLCQYSQNVLFQNMFHSKIKRKYKNRSRVIVLDQATLTCKNRHFIELCWGPNLGMNFCTNM